MKIEQHQIGKKVFIPFSDPLFDLVWEVGQKWIRQNNEKFLTKLDKFKELEKEDFDEIYYCYECQRLEDGCHRSWTMKNKGHDGYDAFVGRICWKKIFNLHKQIKNLIVQSPNYLKKDVLWTDACREKKWNVLKELDFSGKTYLDVGSQSGYSAFMGWNRGAVKVVGVEIKKDIFDVAVEMKKQLKAEEVDFHNLDWVKSRSQFGQFDIVSCMGLMHYFDVKDYDSILDDLCNKANQILILELRVWEDADVSHMVKHNQTLVSVNHLESFVQKKGFKIIRKVEIQQRKPTTPGKRGIWIMERTK